MYHPIFSKELKNPTDKISYLFLKLFFLYFYHPSNLGLHFTYLGYCNYLLELPSLSLGALNLSSTWQLRVYIKNENPTMLKLPVTLHNIDLSLFLAVTWDLFPFLAPYIGILEVHFTM